MAQHIPIEHIQNNKIKERFEKYRGKRVYRSSFKWREIEQGRFLYNRPIRMSQKEVAGGRASIEVEIDDKNIIKEIYLVA